MKSASLLEIIKNLELDVLFYCDFKNLKTGPEVLQILKIMNEKK